MESKFLKKFLPGFLLFFILQALIETAAQTHDIKFNLVSGSNGVTLGKINSITRDRHNVMWFSDQTNRCIVRYDGYSMTRYQHDPKNPNSPGGAYPEVLYADLKGNIWIGYYGMGLDKFNFETNTFTHYQHDPENPQSLSNDTVSAILVDHLGNIWVGTNEGLNLLDQVSGKFTHYKNIQDDSTSLSCNEVRSLFEDSQGNLWIGTGLPWDLNNEGGLNRLKRESGTFTRFMHDAGNPGSLADNKVRAIYEDKNGVLWVGTRGDGLHSLDRKTGTIVRHSYQNNNSHQIARPKIKSPFDHITFITEDAEGYMWIGTLENGLLRFTPDKKNSIHYTSGDNAMSGFRDSSSWQVYASDDGMFWVSTQENRLYRVDLNTNHFPHHNIDNSMVIDFLEDGDSYLWFATNNGLVRKDLKRNSYQYFRNDPSDPGSLSNNIVLRLLKDRQGTLWVGTQNGLNRFNSDSQSFSRFYNNPGDFNTLSSSDISCIYEDPENNLWIGTYKGGLNKFNPKNGNTIHYLPVSNDTTSISSDHVVDILSDESGNLWLATLSYGGINRLNPKTGKFRRYIAQTNIWSLFFDSEGTLWAGGEEGLFWYDKTSDNFKGINGTESGIDVTNVGSMVEDNHQNLWVASADGIYRYNRKNGNLILFAEENNIAAGSLIGSAIKRENGEILFGSNSGYYSLEDGNLNIPLTTPKIYFKNIWINGQLIKPAENSLMTKPLSDINQVKLTHDQNVFSIDLAAIYYGNPTNVKTYYQLDGYDKSWRKLTQQGQVYYFNIPSGDYNLRTRSVSLENGIWVGNNLGISIALPWWRTLWAYVAYAVIFVSGIWIIHTLQRQHVLRVERARTQQRELEQAREIDKAYKELKATQAQLVHSEKMASLGELTAGIAHEIQNPLNFVNNFSEVNSELVDEAELEIDKGNVEEVKAILKNIKENELKVKYHGKKAESIVKSMLLHSRGSGGKMEPTDINSLIDECLRLSFHGFKAKDKSFDASFILDTDESLPKVDVIPQDLCRVLLNLFNNAFYAVNNKSKENANGYKPEVIVSTKFSTDSSEGIQWVVISIKDNGPGISENIKGKIFQPFFTTKPSGQGTGLGLSLSYDIIKAHGGEIIVDSEEGKGTVFNVMLGNKL